MPRRITLSVSSASISSSTAERGLNSSSVVISVSTKPSSPSRWPSVAIVLLPRRLQAGAAQAARAMSSPLGAPRTLWASARVRSCQPRRLNWKPQRHRRAVRVRVARLVEQRFGPRSDRPSPYSRPRLAEQLLADAAGPRTRRRLAARSRPAASTEPGDAADEEFEEAPGVDLHRDVAV